MKKHQRSPAQVKRDLHLDEVPDAAFMALLEQVDAAGEAPPRVPDAAAPITVDQLEAVCITGSVGELLAHARRQNQQSLDVVGRSAGVTRARVQQIEHSDNVELSTLVKIAAALGYRVRIRLEPVNAALPPLTTGLLYRQGAV